MDKYCFLYFRGEDTRAYTSQGTCSRSLLNKQESEDLSSKGVWTFSVYSLPYPISTCGKMNLSLNSGPYHSNVPGKTETLLACLQCVVLPNSYVAFQTPDWLPLLRQVRGLSGKIDSLSFFSLKELDGINLALAYSFVDSCGQRRELGEIFMQKENPYGSFYGRKRTGLFKSSYRVRNLIA